MITSLTTLIRIAMVLASICGCALIAIDYEPRLEAARQRLASAQVTLRSTEVAIAAEPLVSNQLFHLKKRYAESLGDPESAFLRWLVELQRRERVRLIAANAADVSDDFAAVPEVPGGTFHSVRYTIEMTGSYRSLLLSVADLSSGPALVRVHVPSFVRSAGALTATVPLELQVPIKQRPEPQEASP